MTNISSVAGLLESFRAASSSPKLIWYGETNERIELSGRVLENWVAKTSNLLVEELDADESTVVAMNLSPHWKSLIWALACWQVGARSAIAEPPAEADIRLSMEADVADKDVAANGVSVLIAPGALDVRWPGELPVGSVDYAASVRSYGDVYLEEPARPDSVLATDGVRSLTFQDLLSAPLAAEDESASGQPENDDGVWLVPAGLPLGTVLAAVVRIWAGGGAVVLVHPGVEVTDRLLAGERITARLAA
ncbi:TIGR03089 family protein [Arthrobacter tecti]